jgi:hypothetical protein
MVHIFAILVAMVWIQHLEELFVFVYSFGCLWQSQRTQLYVMNESKNNSEATQLLGLLLSFSLLLLTLITLVFNLTLLFILTQLLVHFIKLMCFMILNF